MLRNVPVGSGRRNKNSLKEQEKRKAAAAAAAAAAAVGDGSPMGMGRNPMMAPVGMAGAYAHNRHVLWDPDAGLDVTGGKMGDIHGGAMPPHGYMQPGMPPIPGMPPQPGMRGRPGMPPMPSMPPPAAMRSMPHPGSVPEGSGAIIEDTRPRQRPRRNSPEPPRFPGTHPAQPTGYEGKPHMDPSMQGYMSPASRMGAEGVSGNPMLGKVLPLPLQWRPLCLLTLTTFSYSQMNACTSALPYCLTMQSC